MNLYKGPLFASSLAYGQSLKPDKIFILSAKHHVLDLEEEIEPYDVTLSYVPPDKKVKNQNLKVLTTVEIKMWVENVIEQLGELADLLNDIFIILAGHSYVKPIQNRLKNIEEPLKGVVQGKRPAKLTLLIREINGK